MFQAPHQIKLHKRMTRNSFWSANLRTFPPYLGSHYAVAAHCSFIPPSHERSILYPPSKKARWSWLREPRHRLPAHQAACFQIPSSPSQRGRVHTLTGIPPPAPGWSPILPYRPILSCRARHPPQGRIGKSWRPSAAQLHITWHHHRVLLRGPKKQMLPPSAGRGRG